MAASKDAPAVWVHDARCGFSEGGGPNELIGRDVEQATKGEGGIINFESMEVLRLQRGEDEGSGPARDFFARS